MLRPTGGDAHGLLRLVGRHGLGAALSARPAPDSRSLKVPNLTASVPDPRIIQAVVGVPS